MRKCWIVGVCIVLSLASIADATVWDRIKTAVGIKDQPKAPTIKVLVAKELDGAMVDVKGAYNIYDPYKGTRLGTRFFGKSYYMQPVVEGIKWGEVFPGVYQVVIIPDDPKTTTVVNGIEYKGNIFVYQVDGKMNVVNEVPVEDYVHSVLSAQQANTNGDMSGDREVLAAMAIAMRTDACYQALSNADRFWQVDASRVGYRGYAMTRRSNGLDEVMNGTRYLVLSHTRAFQGPLVLSRACCLDKQLGEGKEELAPVGWNLDKAKGLASKGYDAVKILQNLYPQGQVEMLTSLEQAVHDSQKGESIAAQETLAQETAQID